MRAAWIEVSLLALALACFLCVRDWSSGSSPIFDPVRSPEGGLRVMTWNVGRPAAGAGRALSDDSLGYVAGVIRALEPDLVLLQELASSAQLDALLERLPGAWRRVYAGPEGRRVAFLAPRGEFAHSVRPPEVPRGLLVEVQPAGLVVFGLHANAWSAEERNRQLGAAVDSLRGYEGPAARVLMGDLNLDVDLDKRRDLFSDESHLDVESYNYAARHLVDAAQGSGPTAEPDRRLDYIFVEPGALRVRQAGPLRGWRRDGMDHDPVLADLERR